MKHFACPRCRNKVYFESVTCLKCNLPLGFDAVSLSIVAPQPGSSTATTRSRATAPGREAQLRYCANAVHGVCNWTTASNDTIGYCRACDLNRTIPNLSEAGNLTAWRELERAKKRLVYSLLRLGLPLHSGASGYGGLIFDFARNTTTGHEDGVITIDVLEADAVERERQRQIFGEPYRTLLGHLRHESGHFYWMVLIEAADRLEQFRAVFGDERRDYKAALAAHHGGNVRTDWQGYHVSAYASAHPWEDWAETWAHYLHMIDALDTAEAEAMEPNPPGFSISSIWPARKQDVYVRESFKVLVERWIPLTIAMNSLSRSMGHDEFYPFVITPAVSAKLEFMHRLIRDQHATGGSSPR